jgi:medium-chain acyl-[acyl-carrier-protein] hydrolase
VNRRSVGSSLLNYRQRTTAKVRLFCFPYAGGSAAIFREWADDLSNSFDVWSVEYAGRGARRGAAPFRRISPLVDALLPELRAELTDSYAFFGHSMGALVAFEILRRLRREKAPPAVCFFASGCRAPSTGPRRRQIHDLPELEFIEKLRELGGTPEVVLANDDLMQMALPALRADFEAGEQYAYERGPKLDCPILVYSGLHDSIVSQEDLAEWKTESSDGTIVRMFPGAHFFLHSAKETVLRVLTRDLLTQLQRDPVTKNGGTGE